MSLGGGTFSAQNKILPGTYINFVSKARATSIFSDRGIATMPLILDWSEDEKIIEVSSSDFERNTLKLFGYNSSHEKMKGLRDLFINASKLYFYKLNKGEKATNTYATAKCSGERGNALKVVIAKNVDEQEKFDVSLYLDTTLVDYQTVKTSADLVDNDFVVYSKEAELSVTAGEALKGGTNGEVTGTNYQSYFDKIESYSYNVMGIVTTDEEIKKLAVNFCKRLRDESGVKFQLVLHNYDADYEGVINVINKVTTDSNFNEASILYFITGIEAGCAVNKSCLNKIYDGEFEVNTEYTQLELEDAILNGKLVLHQVGDDIRILKDINSLTTTSDDKGEIFKDNQTIRVIDQIANDIASLFNTKYLGNIPNDASGRISLWNDIVKHHQGLQDMRAIQNFNDSDVEIIEGDSKSAVVVNDKVTIVNTMEKLYMAVTIE